jgi:methylase of polypeptide subunit release factors
MMTTDYISFNPPYVTGKERVYAAVAQRNSIFPAMDL